MARVRSILLLATLIAAAVPCAGEVLFDFNQPFFVQEPGLKCKDHALVRGEDGIYHLYFIESLPDGPIEYLDREQWLGHATSPDLRNWTRQDSILPVVPDSWEEGFIWAPAVVKDPVGEGWYLFYTGADTSAVVRQRMGMAYSTDLYDWVRDENNPIYQPGDWTDWDDPLYQMANCRDPEIFQVPGDENWYCLNTVRMGNGYGALDLAVSGDLHSWAHQDTFSWHGSANLIESADLWQDGNGKWHLFYVVQNYSGTYHTVHAEPWGPWWPGSGSIFDAGTAAEITDFDGLTIYSRHAKVSQDEGDRYYFRFDELHDPAGGGNLPLLQDDTGLEEHWTLHFGDAFTHQPTWGDNPVERGLGSCNLEGNSYLSSLEQYPYPGYPIPGRIRGDGPQGLITSEPFVIEQDRMDLLVGGGQQDSTCFVALVRAVDGRAVFLETGRDLIGMERRLWDTSSLIGLEHFIAVADLESGSGGWICTDQIREHSSAGGDTLTPSAPLLAPPLLLDLVDAAGYDLGVDFSAVPVYGRAPLTVLFEDQTTGHHDSQVWDFQDDGDWDAGYWRPTWIYEEPGLYSVRLQVNNDIGLSGELLRENLVRVLPPESNIICHTVEIQTLQSTPVPISYMGEDSLGQLNMSLDYDPALMDFHGIETLSPDKKFTCRDEQGRITIGWLDETGGENPILPAEGDTLCQLFFTALSGADTTQVAFYEPGCGIRDVQGDSILSAAWIDDYPFGRVILNVGGLVFGHLSYYYTGMPVVGTLMQLDPPGSLAEANHHGDYEFVFHPMGQYLLKPVREGDLGAINSLDALRLTRHVLGKSVMTDSLQLLAAEVTGDGQLDGQDALAIVEAAVKLAPLPLPDWGFVPDSVDVELFATDFEQDFTGYRRGDLDGSWSPGGRPAPAPAPRGRDLMVFSLPDSVLESMEDPVDLPLLVEGLEGAGALSLRVSFADSVLSLDEVIPMQAGLNLVHHVESGVMRLEWYDDDGGDSTLAMAADTLLLLRFTPVGEPGAYSQLHFRPECILGDSLAYPISQVQYLDGNVWLAGSGTGSPAAPPAFALRQNHPNPFNPATEIRFTLAEAGPVTLTVYDLAGRRVRRLAEGRREAGEHSVVWNGRDERGRAQSSGIYFCRLVAGDESASRKMILMK